MAEASILCITGTLRRKEEKMPVETDTFFFKKPFPSFAGARGLSEGSELYVVRVTAEIFEVLLDDIVSGCEGDPAAVLAAARDFSFPLKFWPPPVPLQMRRARRLRVERIDNCGIWVAVVA